MQKKKDDDFGSHADAEDLAAEIAYMQDDPSWRPKKDSKKIKMDEHEEYLNADVPKEVWITRNKYLHKKVEKLTDQIQELQKDSKRQAKEYDKILDKLRKAGL